MRIIGGSARGMNLIVPRKAALRPTADRVRESLLSILGDSIIDARIMDLFAGTGSVGIEALSRGAEHCIFVDVNRECVDGIRQNLGKARLDSRAEVWQSDAYRVCDHRPKPEGLDVIYIDPPYRDSRAGNDARLLRLLRELLTAGLLAPAALVIVEHDSLADLPAELPGLLLSDGRSYGETVLSFFEMQ